MVLWPEYCTVASLEVTRIELQAELAPPHSMGFEGTALVLALAVTARILQTYVGNRCGGFNSVKPGESQQDENSRALTGHSHVEKFQLRTVPKGCRPAGSGDDRLQHMDRGSHTHGTGFLDCFLRFWYIGVYLVTFLCVTSVDPALWFIPAGTQQVGSCLYQSNAEEYELLPGRDRSSSVDILFFSP